MEDSTSPASSALMGSAASSSDGVAIWVSSAAEAAVVEEDNVGDVGVGEVGGFKSSYLKGKEKLGSLY